MSTRPPRLWPAVLIVGLGAAAVAKAWLLDDTIRQYHVMQTLVATILTLVGLLLWLAFFSRLPGRTRLVALGAIFLTFGVSASLFRIRGMSGDLLPIVDFRWSQGEPPPLQPEAPPPTPEPKATAQAAEATASTPVKAKGATAIPLEPLAPASPGWPQFQGPNRDATVLGTRLARDWTRQPPRLVWRRAVGSGWSSFAIKDGLAVTQEQRGPNELVVAYDFATGRPRWSHTNEARFDNVVAGVGPRATPTIADGRVFALGATGILNALDLATGRLLWSHRTVEENGGAQAMWGKSGSPLVSSGRVIVSAGGTEGRALVAYAAQTGERVWAGGHDGASYSSPQLVTLAGRPEVIVFNDASVAGHDPDTGALLWEQPWPGEQPNVAQPLPLGDDRLLFSAGYGVGSKVYALAADDSTDARMRLVWESPRLKSKFANLILHEGFVYGLDDGVLTCLDPATGERRWKGGRYGHGQLLLVGGLLLVQTEEGEAILIDPSPEAPRELTRAALLEGKTWNPPALVGSRLLVRNDREAALYELPLAE